MKSLLRKTVRLLVAASLVLLCVPQFASAATTTVVIPNADGLPITYILNTDTHTASVNKIDITGMTGTEINIPGTVTDDGADYTVVELQGTGTNTNVFGEAIQFAGPVGGANRPSAKLASITRISVPTSVTHLGGNAFSGCVGMTSVSFGENSQLTNIATAAFRYCELLPSIDLPEGLKVIGEESTGGYVFMNCTGLTSITIPGSVTTIGITSFSGCTSLTSVTFAENSQLTFIGDGAFSGCTALQSIEIPEGITVFGGLFSGCTSLTSVKLPEGLTSIGNNSFYGCTSLASITIPQNVTSIGNYAFQSCPLSSIVLPHGLTSLGDSAFRYCNSLVSIDVPEKVKTIACFRDCSSLKTVNLHYTRDTSEGSTDDGVLSFASSAFRNCPNLESILFSGSGITALTLATNSFTGLGSLKNIVFLGNSSNIIMPSAATIKAGASNPALTFRAWNQYNTNLKGWCEANSLTYQDLVSIADCTVTLAGGDTYGFTGSAIEPAVTVATKDEVPVTLAAGTDYAVSYANNVNAGTAKVTISGLGFYEGTSLEVPFTITAKDISSADVDPIADQAYTGSAIEPSVVVKDGSTTLTKDTDYTVAYSSNTNAGTATVTITGIGNYTGTKSVNFTITAKNISSASVDSIADQVWTGSAVEPSVTVKDGETTLVLGTDYTVEYSDNIAIGTATVTITGKGNYTGTKSATFAIGAKSISSATITAIPEQTWTGSAIEPDVVVKDGGTTLVEDTDYTVAYTSNIAVGTATVTITGKGDYAGTKSTTFTIVAKSISSATITAIPNQTWTGTAITPTVTVTDGSTTLVKDTDYTVAYSSNVNVGTASVTITGKGNYSGTKSATFTIVAGTTAPTTTISGVTSGGSYPGSAAFTLSASDNSGSGIAHTYYTLDSGTETAYSGGVTVSALGSHTVTYWSVDVAGNTETAKSITFTVTQATSLMPVYRFYNVKNGAHFYTASAEERDIVIAKWPGIYTFEGVAYSVNTANPANSSPLYRFYNKVNGAHFYTAFEQEKDIVRSKWPSVYTYEGPVYSVCATPAAGATPVYRFYNVKNGSHFYTVSEEERDIVRSKWPNVYTYEGPAFWLAQ